MITIVEKPKLRNIGGIETYISDIKTFTAASDVITYCLENNMPLEIKFGIKNKQEKSEYEKTIHWVVGFCKNLKIEIPQITFEE